MSPNDTSPRIESQAPPLLRLESVAVSFGGLRALGGVDLDVVRGERLAVLGPNGAGKTTLFNVIAGDISPDRGRVLIKAIDCTTLPSRLRPAARRGPDLSEDEAAHRPHRRGQPVPRPDRQGQAHLALWRNSDDAEMRERARGAANVSGSAINSISVVGDLSHGQQRQLEIGIALVTDPDLIMLDEPASGLSRGERERLDRAARNAPASRRRCCSSSTTWTSR